MMTDSQKSFVKVKLWFSQLINQNHSEQIAQIDQLHLDGTLDEAEIKLLKDMLQADQETGMATNIQSAAEEVINQASKQNTSHENKQIGPYKIISPLGEGGMGQVYLAERNDGVFEQKVALKLPHSSFNPQMLVRFENERQILAQLTHNNIAHLLDGGTADNNQPYIAMEYIHGKNIDKYCTENIPSLNNRLKLILQICSAVTFSHQQLVLHRDLKPSNILVTETGQVKLLDFGIAKLLDLDDETKAKNTATQIMTRYYASPEQLQGKPASTHSDMFSLAIIAYELITGYHPFRHKDQHEREQNLISGKIMRVTQRTDNTEALLPELAKIPSGKLQGDLENILLKALSVDPLKRYESVKDFADDLTHFIENKPVSARKSSTIYYLSKWIQRHKTVTALIFTTITTLITATIYSVNKANYAIEQQKIAESETEKANQISKFLKDMFNKAQPSSAEKQITAQDLLLQGFEDINQLEFNSPEIKYELLNTIHHSLMAIGKFKESEDFILEHNQECVIALGQNNKTCVKLIITNALIQHVQYDPKTAIDEFKRAEVIALARKPIDKEELISIYTEMNPSFLNQNRFDESLVYINKIISLEEESKSPNYVRLIQISHELANTSIFNQNFETAWENIEKISGYHPYLPENELKQYMISHNGLISFYYSMNHQVLKAYEYTLKKFEIESTFEVKTYSYARNLRVLGDLSKRSGLFNESKDYYNRAYLFYRENVSGSELYQYHTLTKMALSLFLINQIDAVSYTHLTLPTIYSV